MLLLQFLQQSPNSSQYTFELFNIPRGLDGSLLVIGMQKRRDDPTIKRRIVASTVMAVNRDTPKDEFDISSILAKHYQQKKKHTLPSGHTITWDIEGATPWNNGSDSDRFVLGKQTDSGGDRVRDIVGEIFALSDDNENAFQYRKIPWSAAANIPDDGFTSHLHAEAKKGKIDGKKAAVAATATSSSGDAQALIQRWQAEHANPDSDLARQVLKNVYRFPVRMTKTLGVAWRKNRHEINSNMVLVVPEKYDEDEVLRSLAFRHPVFIGGKPTKSMYNQEQVKTLLGYDAEKMPTSNHHVRYGVLGPMRLFQHPKVSAHAVHVWGPNLEGTMTGDWKDIVTSSTEFDKKRLKRIFREVFQIISDAAHCVRDKMPDKTRLVVRVPRIGLGAFLQALKNENRQDVVRGAQKAFYRGFRKAKAPANTVFQVLDFLDEDEALWKKITKKITTPKSHVRLVLDDANLFKKPGSAKHYLVVNAWDSNSFVGNGLDQDGSIDGWLVSGSGKACNFENDSYLHNAFLSPALMDVDNWRRKI
jgi:hypothetical protein